MYLPKKKNQENISMHLFLPIKSLAPVALKVLVRSAREDMGCVSVHRREGSKRESDGVCPTTSLLRCILFKFATGLKPFCLWYYDLPDYPLRILFKRTSFKKKKKGRKKQTYKYVTAKEQCLCVPWYVLFRTLILNTKFHFPEFSYMKYH